jgi:hypothetical protein
MGWVKLFSASCVVSACVIAASVAVAADERNAAPPAGEAKAEPASLTAAEPAARPATAPALRPGEIVIKPTGRKRVVLATQRVTSGPVAVESAEEERSDEVPRPRAVTIGYFYRDPIEQGYGPQIHWPAYDSSCGYYGYGGYSIGGCYGGYRSYGGYRGYGGYGGHRVFGGYGHGGYGSHSPLLFGSRSYCTPTQSITHVRRGR